MGDTLLEKSSQKRLNIGAGRTFIPGFVNIDISSHADICIDLSEDALPFDDNSVDVIFTHHTLEHIPNYLFALSEIYRVLRHNGVLLVGVPYVTLTEFNLVNPYHKHHFNEHSFNFFDPRKLKGSAMEDNQIKFRKIFHRYHYMGKFKYLPRFLRTWCRRHLFNVVKKIDFGLLAVKSDEAIKEVDTDEMIALFDSSLKSRQRYKLKNRTAESQ